LMIISVLHEEGEYMPISFQCPECAKSFNVRDELAGKKARCKCGAAIQVPQPTQQQPVDPLLGPLSSGQQPFDPLMGPVVQAAQPAATAKAGRKGLHIGVKVGAGAGGVVVLGLLIWLVISLVGGDTETGAGGVVETAAAGDSSFAKPTDAEPTTTAGNTPPAGSDPDDPFAPKQTDADDAVDPLTPMPADGGDVADPFTPRPADGGDVADPFTPRPADGGDVADPFAPANPAADNASGEAPQNGILGSLFRAITVGVTRSLGGDEAVNRVVRVRPANSQSARVPQPPARVSQPPARVSQPPARSPQPVQNAYDLAKRHVEKLRANAQANGDTEKFLEYDSIIAAISVLKTGNSGLANLLGPGVVSRAQGFIGMYINRGSSPRPSRSARSPQPSARSPQPSARSPQPGQNAYELAARHVEKLRANAQANGDIEKFLEYEGILGAILALKTGNSGLANLFGPGAVSRAQGYINMYKN
jgi:hypothetical protein